MKNEEKNLKIKWKTGISLLLKIITSFLFTHAAVALFAFHSAAVSTWCTLVPFGSLHSSNSSVLYKLLFCII